MGAKPGGCHDLLAIVGSHDKSAVTDTRKRIYRRHDQLHTGRIAKVFGSGWSILRNFHGGDAARQFVKWLPLSGCAAGGGVAIRYGALGCGSGSIVSQFDRAREVRKAEIGIEFVGGAIPGDHVE